MELPSCMYWSLFYYLKKCFSLQKKNALLFIVDHKKYTSEDKDWLADGEVRVYINDTEIPLLQQDYSFITNNQLAEYGEPHESYKINYANGEIEFLYPLIETDVVTADYSYTWLDVFPGWKDQEFTLPALFITMGIDYEQPYEIGLRGTSEWYNLQISIDLYGVNESQSSDMAYRLRRYFDYSIPIYDFSTSFPVNHLGFKDDNFNKEEQSIGYMSAENIKVEYNPLRSGEGIEKNRVNIRFVLKTAVGVS